MLLITYGLRAGEVSGLQLDDLDWEREMLRVRCPKPGRTHLYPLSRGVRADHPALSERGTSQATRPKAIPDAEGSDQATRPTYDKVHRLYAH